MLIHLLPARGKVPLELCPLTIPHGETKEDGETKEEIIEISIVFSKKIANLHWLFTFPSCFSRTNPFHSNKRIFIH